MAEHFNVGDVAILQNLHPDHEHWNGCEVQVIASLARRAHAPMSDGSIVSLCYVVERPDGAPGCALPHQLRKKRPPDHPDTVTRWDTCPWWPESLVKEQSHV